MLKFEMEAPIVMESKEEIVEALREMADAIEDGVERDWIKGEVQCMEWYIGEDDEIDYEEFDDEEDEDDYEEFDDDEEEYN